MFFPFLLHKSSVLIAFEQIWSEKYLFKTLWKPCTPFCRLQHCAPFLGWSHISNPKKQFVFVSQAVKPQFTHDFFPWFFPYDNIIKPVLPAISCSCVVKIVWMSVNEAQHSCLFSIQHLNCFCIDENNFFLLLYQRWQWKIHLVTCDPSFQTKEARCSPKRRADGRLSRTSSMERESLGEMDGKKRSDENKENCSLDQYASDQDSWNESVISGRCAGTRAVPSDFLFFLPVA